MSTKANAQTTREKLEQYFKQDSDLLKEIAVLFEFAVV